MRDLLARVRPGGLRLELLEDRSLLSATPLGLVDPVEYVDLGFDVGTTEVVEVEQGVYVLGDYVAEGDWGDPELMWASSSYDGEAYDFGGDGTELPMEAWSFAPVEGEVSPYFGGDGEFVDAPLEPIEGGVDWLDSSAWMSVGSDEVPLLEMDFRGANENALPSEPPAEVVDPAVEYEPFLAYSLPPVEMAVTPPAVVVVETSTDYSAFAIVTAGVETPAFAETPKADAEAVAVVDEKANYDAPAALPKPTETAEKAESAPASEGLTVTLDKPI